MGFSLTATGTMAHSFCIIAVWQTSTDRSLKRPKCERESLFVFCQRFAPQFWGGVRTFAEHKCVTESVRWVSYEKKIESKPTKKPFWFVLRHHAGTSLEPLQTGVCSCVVSRERARGSSINEECCSNRKGKKWPMFKVVVMVTMIATGKMAHSFSIITVNKRSRRLISERRQSAAPQFRKGD